MKEAMLAIIGSTLIDQTQLNNIMTIYKIMDSSGDGKIGSDELAMGFREILGEELTEEELKTIMENVDQDEPKNGYIDFSDFLIASVHTEKKKILEYCKTAYEIFFKNEQESIEVSDLIEILCISKVMKPEFIR